MPDPSVSPADTPEECQACASGVPYAFCTCDLTPADPSVRYNAPGLGSGRAWLCCPTCRDGGMIEDDAGREDVCPTCEGGLWRERESWFSWLNRNLPGFRLARGFPPFYLTRKA